MCIKKPITPQFREYATLLLFLLKNRSRGSTSRGGQRCSAQHPFFLYYSDSCTLQIGESRITLLLFLPKNRRSGSTSRGGQRCSIQTVTLFYIIATLALQQFRESRITLLLFLLKNRRRGSTSRGGQHSAIPNNPNDIFLIEFPIPNA